MDFTRDKVLISITLILSVFIQSTILAPIDSSGTINKGHILNPCSHHNVPNLRHQRSVKTKYIGKQIKDELLGSTKQANKTLVHFEQMYKDVPKFKLRYKIRTPTINSRVDAYYGTQVYMNVFLSMSKQTLKNPTNAVNPEERYDLLEKLFSKTAVLLCEMQEDILFNNKTSNIHENTFMDLVEKNIPKEIENTDLVIQDIEIVKRFRNYLKKVKKFYRTIYKSVFSEKKNNKRRTKNMKKSNKPAKKNGKRKEKRVKNGKKRTSS